MVGAWSNPVVATESAEAGGSLPTREEAEMRWWKGNLHTHSFWSDGDDYPEMIVDWYHRNGYDFLAISDHDILLQGEKWLDVSRRGGGKVLERYVERFGEDWVERKTEGGRPLVRLKTLEEFRGRFESPGKFLLIQSEEISDQHAGKPVHLNATNILELILPQGGDSVLETMQRNVDAVLEQRKRTGRPMFPQVNHPNFGWAVTAEELMQVRGNRFFEVYNGHPLVRNHGDHVHKSTERMWDVMLAHRLTDLGLGVIYGIAVDDAHNYHELDRNRANPGRGWVMVRARELTPEAIVRAMEAGDFYASTGVTLRDVRFVNGELTIEIEPEEGVTYTTQFIGTPREFDRKSEPMRGEMGEPLPVTRKYSRDIGQVLAEVSGTRAVYRLRGDELYVRAKVTSSKPKANPYAVGEVEVAWVQPVVP
jgi:hypothetical protein